MIKHLNLLRLGMGIPQNTNCSGLVQAQVHAQAPPLERGVLYCLWIICSPLVEASEMSLGVFVGSLMVPTKINTTTEIQVKNS